MPVLAVAVAALTSAYACPYAGRSLLALPNIDALHQKMPADDVHRALKPRPPMHSEVVARNEERVSDTLNAHLRAKYPQANLKNCANFTLEELNTLIGALIKISHPAMGKLYEARCNATGAPRGCDKRSLRHSSLEQFEAEWNVELAHFDAFPAHLLNAHPVYSLLREGKCYEAVNIFIHQLTEVLRDAALGAGLTLPLLPREHADQETLASGPSSTPPPHQPAQSVESGRRGLHSLHVGNLCKFAPDGVDYSTCQSIVGASMNDLINKHPNLPDDTNRLYYAQSPCQIAHSVHVPAPEGLLFQGEDTFKAVHKFTSESDTSIEGTGYKSCTNPTESCPSDADNNYYLHAVVRKYKIPGSHQLIWKICDTTDVPNELNCTGSSGKPQTIGEILGGDLDFVTRGIEAMPDQPNSPFGASGGDGIDTVLGPNLRMATGQTLNIFVKNALDDSTALGQVLDKTIIGKQKAWERMQILKSINPVFPAVENDTIGSYDGMYDWMKKAVAWRGAQFLNSSQVEQVPQRPFGPIDPALQGDMKNALAEKDLTWPERLKANVPGAETNGFDVLNLHLHGLEVWPHLFHPIGTSDPDADWISITPSGDQQCYCYKFAISDTQNEGKYIYHTHRHGTTSVLTWGGMYGVADVGVTNVSEARYWNSVMITKVPENHKLDWVHRPAIMAPTWIGQMEDTAEHPYLFSKAKPNLKNDLAYIADLYGFHFEDQDVNDVVIGDLWLQYNSSQQAFTQMDFLSASRGNGMLLVLVNGEYKPTLQARTNALSLFRVICVSTANLCTFQITRDATNQSVGFYQFASDGSTFNHPVWRSPRGNTNRPFENGQTLEAYLSQGGGMRDDVVVMFEHPGDYTIYSVTASFDNNVHNDDYVTARVKVAETDVKDDKAYKNRKHVQKFGGVFLNNYKAMSSRPNPSESGTTIDEYRAVSFMTAYNQEHYPFPFYGVSSFNKTGIPATVEEVEPYDYREASMVSTGGSCGIWTIRSSDIQTHPFHIHVNPFYVLSAGSEMGAIDKILDMYPDYTAPWSTAETVGRIVPNVWRDTVMVPPFGFVRIQMCFDASPPSKVQLDAVGSIRRKFNPNTFAGKFVFHCHFLPHEDKGLMRNVYLVAGRNPLYTKYPDDTWFSPSLPPPAPCMAWCAGHSKPWDTKCFFADCAGCPECLMSPPPPPIWIPRLHHTVQTQAVAPEDEVAARPDGGSVSRSWVVATFVLIGMTVILAGVIYRQHRSLSSRSSSTKESATGKFVYGTGSPAEKSPLTSAP